MVGRQRHKRQAGEKWREKEGITHALSRDFLLIRKGMHLSPLDCGLKEVPVGVGAAPIFLGVLFPIFPRISTLANTGAR